MKHRFLCVSILSAIILAAGARPARARPPLTEEEAADAEGRPDAPDSGDAAISEDGRVPNPIFAYTHLLPRPLTLPGGRLVLGTDTAYGIFSALEISTNLVQDLFQSYNATLKLNFVNRRHFTVGAYVSFETFNYNAFDNTNPDFWARSWQPGMVTGYEILPDFAAFIGGNLNVTNQTLPDHVQTSGYMHGAQVETDLAWAYNPKAKGGGLGNVISGGVTYDVTYKVAGFGLSHSWPGFKLGAHYYVNADRNRFLPILAGGAVIDF